MRTIIFLFLLTIIISCNNSGGGRVPITQNPGMNNDTHPFLKEGTYKVEFYSGKELTTRDKQLLQKFSKQIEWNSRLQQYFRQLKEGRNPAYNANIGISKKEYNQFIEIFSYKEPARFTGSLTIIRDGQIFKFRGEGRLSLLDSVTIGINNKSASFRNYNMNLVADSIDLSGEHVPPGDTITTYQFYKGPDGLITLTGLGGEYELLIGTLKPSGRIYLSFLAKQPNQLEHPVPNFITAWIN